MILAGASALLLIYSNLTHPEAQNKLIHKILLKEALLENIKNSREISPSPQSLNKILNQLDLHPKIDALPQNQKKITFNDTDFNKIMELVTILKNHPTIELTTFQAEKSQTPNQVNITLILHVTAVTVHRGSLTLGRRS